MNDKCDILAFDANGKIVMCTCNPGLVEREVNLTTAGEVDLTGLIPVSDTWFDELMHNRDGGRSDGGARQIRSSASSSE